MDLKESADAVDVRFTLHQESDFYNARARLGRREKRPILLGAMVVDATDREWEQLLRDLEPMASCWHDLQLSFTARNAALAMGLGSSKELQSWLTARGFPPYLILRNWYYLALLAERFHADSLAHWALEREHDPAVYYRFVLRTSGVPWKEVQQRGARWVKARALAIWRPYRRPE